MFHDLRDDRCDMLSPGQADLLSNAPLLMCLGVALVVRQSANSRSRCAFLVRRWFGHVDVMGSILLDLRGMPDVAPVKGGSFRSDRSAVQAGQIQKPPNR
jgi:hypothetical protein